MTIKPIFVAAMVAVGTAAFAAPSLTINRVATVDPWDGTKGAITVDYTLGGLDAETNYKVAFDITANGRTASVMNAAAQLENKAYSRTFDTTALFGNETVAKDAKVRVALIPVTGQPLAGLQLWQDGPFWAIANLGESGASDSPEYGGRYTFAGAMSAVAELEGEWRLPSRDEFQALLDNCDKGWDDVRKGYVFTGKGDYVSNSIFLPAAGAAPEDVGLAGYYWSSSEKDFSNLAWFLVFADGIAEVTTDEVSKRLSVRAVQAAPVGPQREEPVATDEAEFWLGPTEVKVSLTTGTGYGYAVTNLTLMAEIAPSSAGGTTYLLPIGAKIGIYCVAEADYDVVGTNPYVIDEVDFDTTIDPGELPTAEARPGTEANPWTVGDGVTAYVKGATLIINGTGAVASTPWTDKADSVVELVKTKGVTGLEGIVATLPALTAVNGLTLPELNGLAAGAVKASGFNAIAIDPATQEATLSVVICKAESLDEPEWKPVSTNDVPVKADTPAGFFIVAPLAK